MPWWWAIRHDKQAGWASMAISSASTRRGTPCVRKAKRGTGLIRVLFLKFSRFINSKTSIHGELPKNFGLIGVAGYIAVRHLKAIKDTGNNLLASLDKFDSVGILDSFFPKSDFFVEFERFDRHFDKLKRTGTKLISWASALPIIFMISHIRFALRHGADAICEKPIVLNPWNVDALQEIEMKRDAIFTQFFSRAFIQGSLSWRKRSGTDQKNKIYDIDLTYITSRGNWYYISWKGDVQKSGGVPTNIGIHFFDMLRAGYSEV